MTSFNTWLETKHNSLFCFHTQKTFSARFFLYTHLLKRHFSTQLLVFPLRYRLQFRVPLENRNVFCVSTKDNNPSELFAQCHVFRTQLFPAKKNLGPKSNQQKCPSSSKKLMTTKEYFTHANWISITKTKNKVNPPTPFPQKKNQKISCDTWQFQ